MTLSQLKPITQPNKIHTLRADSIDTLKFQTLVQGEKYAVIIFQ